MFTSQMVYKIIFKNICNIASLCTVLFFKKSKSKLLVFRITWRYWPGSSPVFSLSYCFPANSFTGTLTDYTVFERITLNWSPSSSVVWTYGWRTLKTISDADDIYGNIDPDAMLLRRRALAGYGLKVMLDLTWNKVKDTLINEMVYPAAGTVGKWGSRRERCVARRLAVVATQSVAFWERSSTSWTRRTLSRRQVRLLNHLEGLFVSVSS